MAHTRHRWRIYGLLGLILAIALSFGQVAPEAAGPPASGTPALADPGGHGGGGG